MVKRRGISRDKSMSHPQQWYKSVIFSAKPYSLTVRSPIHKGFLSGVFVFKHQGVHQVGTCRVASSTASLLKSHHPRLL